MLFLFPPAQTTQWKEKLLCLIFSNNSRNGAQLTMCDFHDFGLTWKCQKLCFFLKFFLTLLVSSGLLHLKKKFPKNHSHKNENKIVKLRDSATLCVQEEPDFYRENLAKDQFRFSGWQLWNKERYFLAFIWPISQAPFWQEKLTKMYPIKRQLQQGTLHIRKVHLIFYPQVFSSGGAGHSHEFFFKN